MLSAPKAVLFDIDGTIMRAGGAGREALVRAAARSFSAELAAAREACREISFNGRTDSLIFADVAARLGRADYDHAALIAAYLAELDGCLDTAEVKLMPGIATLVGMLARMPGLTVGLLTGNVREGARRKLGRVQLHHLAEQPGGFGDDGRERHDVAAVAMQRLATRGVRPWSTLIVGDSLLDVTAAHHVGAPVVAVATGWTSRAELDASGAQLVVEDLANPGPLLDLLARL